MIALVGKCGMVSMRPAPTVILARILRACSLAGYRQNVHRCDPNSHPAVVFAGLRVFIELVRLRIVHAVLASTDRATSEAGIKRCLRLATILDCRTPKVPIVSLEATLQPILEIGSYLNALFDLGVMPEANRDVCP